MWRTVHEYATCACPLHAHYERIGKDEFVSMHMGCNGILCTPRCTFFKEGECEAFKKLDNLRSHSDEEISQWIGRG
jgi:hypothetical protein